MEELRSVVGGGRDVSQFIYILFICAAASAYYGVRALDGVGGEGRKGHITARGYGGLELASGSRGETQDLPM